MNTDLNLYRILKSYPDPQMYIFPHNLKMLAGDDH